MQRGSLYLKGNRGVYGFHPLTKLLLVGLFLVSAATLPTLTLLLTVYLIQLLLAAWSGLFKVFLKTSLAIIAPFAISLVIIQGFFMGGETELFRLGSFALTLQGVTSGLIAAARILLALSGALLLMLSTRPDHLMLALTQRGLPNSLAYIVLTSIQIFPRFEDRARVIQEAQEARGLEFKVNLIGRLRLLVPLVGPLVLSSIVDVEERAMALEARAFSRVGTRTSLLTLQDSFAQRSLRLLILLAMISLVAGRIFLR